MEVVEHSQNLELLVNADDWQTCCGSSLADFFLILNPIFQILNPNLSDAQPCASEAQPHPEPRASDAQPHHSSLLAESAYSADSADMFVERPREAPRGLGRLREAWEAWGRLGEGWGRLGECLGMLRGTWGIYERKSWKMQAKLPLPQFCT